LAFHDLAFVLARWRWLLPLRLKGTYLLDRSYDLDTAGPMRPRVYRSPGKPKVVSLVPKPPGSNVNFAGPKLGQRLARRAFCPQGADDCGASSDLRSLGLSEPPVRVRKYTGCDAINPVGD